ncbi:MAG: phage holin family protein, partial [Alistipes sp.]|nr:phage holin family protein [Alistipes sp.]
MKSIIGISSSILALFAPVHSLICCALLFICINFLTGVIASYKRATRQGKPWAFESPKAWRTLYKLIFIAGGIVMLWLIDTSILSFANLHLANLFTGFACGVELW